MKWLPPLLPLLALLLGACEQKPSSVAAPVALQGKPEASRALSPQEEKALSEQITARFGTRLAALASDRSWTGKDIAVVLRTGAGGTIEEMEVQLAPPHPDLAASVKTLLSGACAGICPSSARGKVVLKVLQAVRPPRPFAVAVSADGKRVARVLNDPVAKSVELFDALTGERLADEAIPPTDGHGVGSMAALALAGSHLILQGHDQRTFFDLEAKQARVLESGAIWGLQKVSMADDGSGALFCLQPHTFLRGTDPEAKPGSTPPPAPPRDAAAWLRLDVEGAAVTPLPPEMPAACDAAISPDGRWLAARRAGLEIGDLRAGKSVLARPAAAGCSIRGAAFSRDGKTLSAVEECAAGARLLRFAVGTWAAQSEQPLGAKDLSAMRGLSHDGRLGFLVPYGGDASVVDLVKGEILYRFPQDKDRAEVVLLDGEAFATNLDLNPRQLMVHSLAERRPLWTLSNVPGSVPAKAAALAK